MSNIKIICDSLSDVPDDILKKYDIDLMPLTAFDSNSVSFGAGVLVKEAGRLLSEGKSIEEIISALEVLRDETFVIFSVDALDHLQKGGRISSTKASIGNILSIKPILEVKDGLVFHASQVRGKKNVISKILEIIEENCGSDLSDQVVNIGYSDDIKEKEQLTRMLTEKFNPKEIMFFQILYRGTFRSWSYRSYM